MKDSIAIRDYAIEQMNRLLMSLASEVQRTAKTPGADQIHDLRVSMRRFQQALDLFAAFFPKGEVKKIQKLQKRMLRLTSEIRNRDITMEFLIEEKIETHRKRVEKERTAYQRDFAGMARRWTRQDFSAKWANALSLGGV